MKAFVTGSTGLLGSNLVRLLVEQGHEVKALVRSPDKATKLLPKERVELVKGDMEDVAGFATALKGCDVLFHTAAYFREYYDVGVDHWAKLEKINIQGALQLLTAAEQQGIHKVIHVSSSATIGKTSDNKPSDESTPPDAFVYENLYAKSKLLGDRAIDEWRTQHTLPVVFILPGAIFGPADAAPTAAGQLTIDFVNRKIPAVPPGGFSVVDVRDVAQGMINAVERGKNGERYLLSNRFYSVAEIMQILERITGIPAPRLPMPYPLALAFGWFSENLARFTGGKPTATLSAVRILHNGRVVTATKAQRELGATFRNFETTLYDEVRWYVENGYIKPEMVQKMVRQS